MSRGFFPKLRHIFCDLKKKGSHKVVAIKSFSFFMLFKDVSSFRNFTLDKEFSFVILITILNSLQVKVKD